MPVQMSSPLQTPAEPPQEQNGESSNDLLNLDKNEDYQSVLKALDILKQQLKRATGDVKTLETLKTEAMKDPYAFVVDLRQKKSIKAPKLQKVIAVPPIDWNKYRFLPESRLVQQANALQNLTQHYQTKKSTYCNIIDTTMPIEYHSNPSTPVAVQYMQQELAKATQAMRQLPSRANSVSDFSEDEDDTDSIATKTTPHSMTRPKQSYSKSYAGKGIGKRRTSVIQHTNMDTLSPMEVSETESPVVSRLQSIEPRTPDDHFSMETTTNATFNQPWSEEEQKRLQELLVIYPDEPVQAQRFNKISKALGTRTPRQVASRVQKYFIKLAKVGLPVPGRITIPPSCLPKGEKIKTKVKSSKPKSNQGRISKPTPSTRTSGMGYNSIVSGGITNSRISGAAYSNAQGPPAIFMSDEEDDSSVAEMMRAATNENAMSTELVIHEGYACDDCGTEPIVGVRYKCTVCDVSEEVDLCGICMEKGTFTNDHHTTDHTFEAIRTANPLPYYADNDYKSPEHLGEYSYLGF